jgi:hypothetical protein
LAALCAWRAKGEHRRAALPLTMAAVALALVAVVVLGDLVLSYRAPHSALVPIWSSKPAGILADVGTLVGVAGAAWGARQLLLVQAKAWPPGLTPLLVIGLLAQLAFTVSGLLGRPPWPLRVGQALLFAAGAVSRRKVCGEKAEAAFAPALRSENGPECCRSPAGTVRLSSCLATRGGYEGGKAKA